MSLLKPIPDSRQPTSRIPLPAIRRLVDCLDTGGAFFISETIMKTAFVLYVEHDDRPPDISAHATLYAAETALLECCPHTIDPVELPEDPEKLTEAMAEHGEFARIYECSSEDGSEIFTCETLGVAGGQVRDSHH
jgi:hypothetical protein